MSDVLRGRHVAILATNGIERVEFEQPRHAVEGAGAQLELLSIHDGEIAARSAAMRCTIPERPRA